ncbi:MAG: M3 family oligoendopeptidase [Proteobacteria bacterium]|nr:M3 family oligoendopeptidase [Pseudomonadota bacterium]
MRRGEYLAFYGRGDYDEGMPATAKKLPASPPLPVWSLADLYDPNRDGLLDAQMETALAEAEALAKKYKGRLRRLDGAGLAEVIAGYQNICEACGRVASYAELDFATNMADAKRGQVNQRMREAMSGVHACLLFVTYEITEFDADHVAGLKADAKTNQKANALAQYLPWLRLLWARKPHQLSLELETMLVERAPVGKQAWIRLFDEMAAGLRFDVDGKQVTEADVLNMMSDADPAMREKAGLARSKTLTSHSRTMALILNTIAKEKAVDDKWRGFADPVSGRNLANDVADEVVAALVATISQAMPRLSHRYYAIKAKWMGETQLAWWDRNAPVPGEDERIFAWDEAQTIVTQAFALFDPEFATLAQRFFSKPWIDAQPRPGKVSGAFSHATVPSAHPYILLNYYGRAQDVMTLAHELGHGIHQLLAARQGYLLADTPLTLAETASSFAEMLVFTRLLKTSTSKEARRALLANKIEDMLNTVARQIGFHNFEYRFHQQRKQGELTASDIDTLWMESQAHALGPAIRLDDSYRPLWGFIPHFVHTPFYVYSYAFGDGLVAALWQNYQTRSTTEETAFITHYKNLLAAGGSQHHSEALAQFGLDASTPQFWQLTVEMISDMIDQLETALDEDAPE